MFCGSEGSFLKLKKQLGDIIADISCITGNVGPWQWSLTNTTKNQDISHCIIQIKVHCSICPRIKSKQSTRPFVTKNCN